MGEDGAREQKEPKPLMIYWSDHIALETLSVSLVLFFLILKTFLREKWRGLVTAMQVVPRKLNP